MRIDAPDAHCPNNRPRQPAPIRGEMWGGVPLPNWGGALSPEKICKLHADNVKFGAYFATYEVAYKANEHRPLWIRRADRFAAIFLWLCLSPSKVSNA